MQKNLKTQLKKVKGLGSAKDGTAHWFAERLTSIALLPLVIWFAYSVIHLLGTDYSGVLVWIKNPITAVMLLAFIPLTFYHSALGLQVVIEDYIHKEGVKFFLLIGLRLFFSLLTIASVFSTLYINFKL